MIPSNTDKTPFIFRFLDSLGVPHTVVPSNHSHSQSEVDGLETALNAKANTADVNSALAGKMDKMTVDEEPTSGSNNLVKSGGVFGALQNKVYRITAPNSTNEKWAYVETDTDGDDGIIQLGVKSEGEEDQVVEISHNNFANLIRALHNPDSTPTESSDNLVTSGGVEAAIIPVISVSDMDYKQGDDGHYVFVVSGVFEQDGDPEKRLLYISGKSLPAGIRVTQVLLGPNGYQTRSTRLGQSYGNWTSYQYAIQSWVDTQLAGKMDAMTVENTPTENSNNLVTSGGVAAALAAKANKDDVDFKVFERNAASDKINLSTDFAQGQKRATYLIINNTSSYCGLSDLFSLHGSGPGDIIIYPVSEQPSIPADGFVVVSVLKYTEIPTAANYIVIPQAYY